MAWCEANRVDYVFGLARNERLVEEIKAELAEAAAESVGHRQAGPPLPGLLLVARWTAGAASAASSARPSGPAARPIRASSSPRSSPPRPTRGISTRRSTAPAARWRTASRSASSTCSPIAPRRPRMRANQLRLWFASMAYVLLCALRRIGLAHTQFAQATCGTIRLKLLKIGALVRVSVRRIKIAMASACPWQDEFGLAHAWLTQAAADTNQKPGPHIPNPPATAASAELAAISRKDSGQSVPQVTPAPRRAEPPTERRFEKCGLRYSKEIFSRQSRARA